jgi:hypothetical protein
LSEAASLSLRDTTVVVRRPVTRFKRSKGAVAGVAAAKAQAQAPPVAAAAAAGGAAGAAGAAGGASAAACAAPAAAAGAGAEAAAAEGGEGEGEGEEEEVLVDAAFGDIVEIAGTDIKTDVLFTPTVRQTPEPPMQTTNASYRVPEHSRSRFRHPRIVKQESPKTRRQPHHPLVSPHWKPHHSSWSLVAGILLQ